MIKHQDFIAAAVTGELPIQSFGKGFGGRDDFEGDAAWHGCIDAPDAILLGGCVAVDTSRHGGCYEGTTARTWLRG